MNMSYTWRNVNFYRIVIRLPPHALTLQTFELDKYFCSLTVGTLGPCRHISRLDLENYLALHKNI